MTDKVEAGLFENRATVTRRDPYVGDEMVLRFWAPAAGGYVLDGDGGQVCKGMRYFGPTLMWDPAHDGTLADLIRRECS